MSDLNAADQDLIKELRLRRWARMNYVPAEKRDDSWSTIILEEMCRKEAELREADENRVPVSAYVPLAPASTSSHTVSSHTVHGGHKDVSPGHVAHAPVRASHLGSPYFVG